ncbi:hypothetical protein THAOC_22016, partial [Thalassiosira oceanica]
GVGEVLQYARGLAGVTTYLHIDVSYVAIRANFGDLVHRRSWPSMLKAPKRRLTHWTHFKWTMGVISEPLLGPIATLDGQGVDARRHVAFRSGSPKSLRAPRAVVTRFWRTPGFRRPLPAC